LSALYLRSYELWRTDGSLVEAVMCVTGTKV
jgi:hypothetical protein